MRAPVEPRACPSATDARLVWVQDALTEAKEVTGVHGDGRERFVDPAGVWSPDSPRGGRVGVRGRLPVLGAAKLR
jgi:hypothetical protein